jgi:hypothetical protein
LINIDPEFMYLIWSFTVLGQDSDKIAIQVPTAMAAKLETLVIWGQPGPPGTAATLVRPATVVTLLSRPTPKAARATPELPAGLAPVAASGFAV